MPERGLTVRALPYLPFALITLVLAPVGWPGRPDVADDYVFWSAGRIIVTGGSPYDSAAWHAAALGTPGIPNVLSGISAEGLGTLWLYPPWTAAMFAPFGLLPNEIGVPLIHIALFGCGIAAVVLLVRSLQLHSPWTIALALAIGASFMPLVLALHIGHFDALLLVGALLVAQGLDGRTPTLIAGAILLSTKPHLFVVFAVVIAVRLIRSHRWRQLGPPVAAVAALAIIGFSRYPLPIDQFLRVGAIKSTLELPVTVQLVQSLGATDWLAAVATGLVVVAAWFGLAFASSHGGYRRGEWPLVSGALVVSLIASPYVQVWDHALVLPALFVGLAATADAEPVRRVLTRVAVVAIAIGAWVAYFARFFVETQYLSALVPIAAAALLLVALLIAPRRSLGSAAGLAGAR